MVIPRKLSRAIDKLYKPPEERTMKSPTAARAITRTMLQNARHHLAECETDLLTAYTFAPDDIGDQIKAELTALTPHRETLAKLYQRAEQTTDDQEETNGDFQRQT
jgi:hypothetical protein